MIRVCVVKCSENKNKHIGMLLLKRNCLMMIILRTFLVLL